MPDPPLGVVTFLFMDIEGSTRLWEDQPEVMRAALQEHDALLYDCISRHGGQVFKTVGDAFCAAFSDATKAIAAALDAQLGLVAETSCSAPPLKVRMAIHTGEPDARDGDYFGQPVNRVARILSTAHGGQTLMSNAAWERTQGMLPPQVSLIDRGAHRLKDLAVPERLFQLAHPGLPTDFPPLRSLSTHPNNLPAQVTSFVGRQADTTAIRGILESGARLVTITGLGGAGKTRIALEVAADLIERYPGGVWWVDLTQVSDPSKVMNAIASALRVDEESNRPAMELVIERLSASRSLITLDNFERLVEAAGDLGTMVRSCPELQVVVTSRAVLNLSIEHEYAVDGLPSDEAFSLFVQRAHQVRPALAIDESARNAIESICTRLDGIPLAIELAAAQVRMFNLTQIERQLDRALKVLVSPFKDVASRQRTMGAAIDWSYDLLAEDDRQLFARLSVFPDSFNLEAAQSVINSDDVTLGIIRLRDQSLLKTGEDGEVPRFHMLDILRTYGREKLADSGEHDKTRKMHAEYYADFALRYGGTYDAADQERRLALLTQESGNLRAALEFEVIHGSLDQAAQMSVALAPLLERRAWLRELRRLVRECADRAGDIPDINVRASLLRDAGWLAYRQGDQDAAEALQIAGLALWREQGDRKGESEALNNLALVAQDRLKLATARELFADSLDIARELDDESMVAARLNNLAMLDIRENRLESARERLLEAESIFERRGDEQGAAACLCNLGDLAVQRKDWQDAREISEKCLLDFRRLSDQRGVASSLTNLAHALSGLGDNRGSQIAIDEAFAISEEIELSFLIPELEELRSRVAGS